MPGTTLQIVDLINALYVGKIGHAKTGSTATVINSDITSVANQWQNGFLIFLSGQNENVWTDIVSNTADTITVGALPFDPAEGDTFLIYTLNQIQVFTSENLAEWAGTVLASPQGDNADNVAPVTSGEPVMLARLTGWTGAAWSRLKLAVSGSLTTRDDSSSATDAAVPATAMMIGGSDGVDLRAVATDSLGRPEITSTGILTDGSGTIATGGTAQAVFAAKPNRRYLLIQNNSTGPLWINFTTEAVAGQPSIQLSSGGTAFVMETGFVSTEAVSIIGATTGQAFTAKEA